MEGEVHPSVAGDDSNIMNDLTSPLKAPGKGTDDVDTCRICRAEGTDEEPLFYPCKCSGSIKFVHQECLMEWLSHSQKKHCELCKTPFRFTKLYHPEMPKSLPTVVFIRKATLHTVRGFVTWCRAMLVASVWLFWLPWSMRFIWWGLFWIGDGGWVYDGTTQAFALNLRHQPSSGIPSADNTTTETMASQNYQQHSGLLSLILQSSILKSLPVVGTFLSASRRDDASHVGFHHTLHALNTTDVSNSTQLHASLLSDIPFFKNLTPNPAFNKLVTNVLEGQIITLSVVIAFVLIFLIREWVVQQQPLINMRNDVREAEERLAIANLAETAHVGNGQHGNGAATPESRPTTPEELDVTLTDPEHIEGLIAKLLPTNVDLESIDISQLSGEIARSSDADEETAKLLSAVRMSLLGIRKVTPRALEIGDVELLKVLLGKLHSNKDIVLARMPTGEIEEVSKNWDKTTEWVEMALRLVEDQKDLEKSQKELEELAQQYTTVWDKVSSSANSTEMTSANFGASASTSTTRIRPNLPERSQSSIATGIRRTIEETGESSGGLVRLDTAADEEDGSEGSDASGSVQSLHSVASAEDTDQPSTAVRQSGRVTYPVLLDDRAEAGSSESRYSEAGSLNSADPPEPVAIDPDAATAHNPLAFPDLHDAEEEDTGSHHHLEIDAAQQRNLWHRFWDWWWGGIIPATPDLNRAVNDEHIVLNLADEPPFVPFVDAHLAHRHEEDNGDEQAGENAIGNALQVGFDANEAEIEEAEDLEGIMELIGMQGPLANLFQNSVFCAILISATVLSAVWLPYLWGKIVLVFLANPLQLALKAPFLFVSGFTNFAIDLSLFLGGAAIYWIDSILQLGVLAIAWLVPMVPHNSMHSSFGKALGNVADSAFLRMSEHFLSPSDGTASDFYHLSLSSHAALYAIRANLANAFSQGRMLLSKTHWFSQLSLGSIDTIEALYALPQQLHQLWLHAPSQLSSALAKLPDLYRGRGITTTIIDPAPSSLAYEEMAPWSTADRLVAIAAGYAFFAVAGALYLKAGSPITTSTHGKRIEAMICDVLQQAGGVLKVILIISIEMLLFPLYCGFLLDIATLPLFEATTIQSRIDLTLSSPWTFGFVHWFVGTCYMFHFALFVSMCRKIVRSGVLYFIRDPDDPTFHPVRDVLERSISSQLRKIGFSALVYGALVSLCMGSVVWGVSVFPGVFPIRWSLETQVLEFPIDLLLYNTLTPLVVHLLKPSRGLHTVYEWWFRRCARVLRLSQFLFGEYFDDEEGHDEGAGRYVRAPGSDQVRIPKGRSVFVEVDANDNRLDGMPDEQEGEHGETNDRYTKVYIPPWFRIRIGLFVFCLWALTAAAGLSFTVAPLVMGRWILSFFVQKHLKLNDIYTFSVGICILGAAYYLGSTYETALVRFKEANSARARTLSTLKLAFKTCGVRALRIVYTYSALLILIPSLLALILEVYLIMPLHAYTTLQQVEPKQETTGVAILVSFTHSTANDQGPGAAAAHTHTIHILQDWTLGLLYLRILLRLCLWNPASRPALALRAIVNRGWLNPNAGLATRCFILPCTVLGISALLIPVSLGCAVVRLVAALDLELGLDEVNLLRFTYPAVLSVGLAIWIVWAVGRAAGRWKSRIKDEAYLIGERLHNFGEKKPPPMPPRRDELGHENVE